MTTDHTTTNLRHIATHWTDLRDLLTTRTSPTWYGVGLQHHLTTDDDENPLTNHQAATERAERTATAPGERPAPLRVSALDTITAIEDDLLELADWLASNIQRPAFTIRGASPHDTVARDIAMQCARDSANPTRWHFNRTPSRYDAQHAATWIADRLAGPAGPHRALTHAEHLRVTTVAAGVRRRVDRALGERTGRTATGRPCACGGQLDVVESKDGAEPLIQCDRCGTAVTIGSLLDRLNAA